MEFEAFKKVITTVDLVTQMYEEENETFTLYYPLQQTEIIFRCRRTYHEIFVDYFKNKQLVQTSPVDSKDKQVPLDYENALRDFRMTFLKNPIKVKLVEPKGALQIKVQDIEVEK
jgi:hypothetical protein